MHFYNWRLHAEQFFYFFAQHPTARKFWTVFFGLFMTFQALNWLFPLPDTIQYSQIVTAKDGTVLSGFLSPDDKWRMKTELHEITPDLQKAFIEKEDKYFYYHFGINPLAIGRALLQNIVKGKKVSGASTITMQVARLLEPKKRTYTNKLKEVFRALQLEWKYSKQEILQLYLNLVPYGSNIEGVKAASLLYYNQLPNQLSIAQITALTIIPNRPTSLSLGKNNDKILQERNRWLKRFEEEGVFSGTVIADAVAEPFKAQRYKAPKMAVHFASWLHRKQPTTPIIHTTIQTDLQRKVEDITTTYCRSLQYLGIYNAAVLVLDNKTSEVAAYLGSPNFYDMHHNGQVDGVRAYRSPGSALKPLIYGMAFDKGIITPKTKLLDVPVDFDGYTPENFNREFNGLITAEKALAVSLNVPAVSLLNEVGVKDMVQKLKQTQFQLVTHQQEILGLSLALGGCGVSLWEMVGLYASFANGGVFQPVKYQYDMPISHKQAAALSQQRILSPEANFMLTEILTKVERPAELPNSYEHNPKVPKIAWKTGTSYGRRDAWSIGFNQQYTVGVWVGNFSGEGRPELTGATIATPLLFKLFNVLSYNAGALWFQMPKSLDVRPVCAETGKSPNQFCEHFVGDYFIAGVTDNQPCQHLKNVFVDTREVMSYCTHCLPTTNFKQVAYPNISPQLQVFYEQRAVAYRKIPPHNPDCTAIKEGKAPTIISPMHQRDYFIDDQTTELLLQAQVDNDVKQLYWYIDDVFYKAAPPNSKVFFVPEKGKVKISCSDDKGRNSNIWVKVR